MADKTPSFATKPDDPKDVSWGLTTAAACWKRNDRSEALRWLRKAVEAASEAEMDERALELAKIAADMATHIGSIAPPRPATSAPNAPNAPGRPSASPTVPRGVPMVTAALVAKAAFPKPAPPAGERIATAPAAPTASVPSKAVAPPAPTANVPSKDAPKKADRKSITSEGPRKRAASRADRVEAPRRPSRTDEMDQWPTDVLAGADLPPGLGAENASLRPTVTAGKGAQPVRAAQAVRVLVWLEHDGTVHVTAVGSGRGTPSHAVEATLAAVDPDTDLVALLR